MLYHGLTAVGLPVVCIESRQAYQALKSLATHKTDRNDARGLAHLARSGFFKAVHVKSPPAHAVRALITARKKLVGQRVMLENQIRGLGVVFGVRLPRALNPAFIDQALRASEGINGLSAAMEGLITARTAVLSAVAAIDADIKKMAKVSGACGRVMTIPGVGQLTALAFTAAVDDPERFRRSRDIGAYLGLVPRRYQSGESIIPAASPNAATGDANPALRGRKRHADALQKSAEAEGLGAGARKAVDDAKGTHCSRPAADHHHACDAAARHRVQSRIADDRPDRRPKRAPERSDAPGEGMDDGADSVASGQLDRRLRFQPSRSIPSLPHQVPPEHVENAGTRKRRQRS